MMIIQNRKTHVYHQAINTCGGWDQTQIPAGCFGSVGEYTNEIVECDVDHDSGYEDPD